MHRLPLDFSDADYEDMEKTLVLTECTSKAEYIRRAMRLLKYVVELPEGKSATLPDDVLDIVGNRRRG